MIMVGHLASCAALSFLVRAAYDNLPCPQNLSQWFWVLVRGQNTGEKWHQLNNLQLTPSAPEEVDGQDSRLVNTSNNNIQEKFSKYRNGDIQKGLIIYALNTWLELLLHESLNHCMVTRSESA